jgi:hypothetical protein
MAVFRRGFLAGVPGALALPLATRLAYAGGRDNFQARGPSHTFAGLEKGRDIAPFQVEHVGPLERGGRTVLLTGPGSERFELEILLRDAAGPKPPGESEVFAVFVKNAGNGSISTDEEQGLCAMAVATHLREREATIDKAGFLTMRERAKAYARDLDSTSRPSPDGSG